MKEKRRCAYPGCNLTRNAGLHAGAGYEHNFVDPRPPGLQPISESRRELLKDSGYSRAARAAIGKPCGIGSPHCTGVAEHLHEPLTRARAGGLEAALRDGPEPVAACDRCQVWIHQDPEGQRWARERGLLLRRQDVVGKDADAGNA